jgi:hypothetical protein
MGAMLRRTFLVAGLGLAIVAVGRADSFASTRAEESGEASFFGLPGPEVAVIDGNQASLSGGLGNTRSDIDEAYGQPQGLLGTMLSYRDGAIGVRFTQERATAILVRLSDPPTNDVDLAREKVRALAPPDSVLIGTMGAGPNRIADLYESARLATKVVAPGVSESGGRFVAIYQGYSTGVLTQVLIAVGSVEDQTRTNPPNPPRPIWATP